MNRKSFLSSVARVGAALPFTNFPATDAAPGAETILIPKYLQFGDTIGICCPAGDITYKDIDPSIKQIEDWGYKVRIGSTVGKKDIILGGVDEDRRKDFQSMLDDPVIRAVMCARGGYGTVRIIDRLDFSTFLGNPKWVVGFSDITVLHSHLNRNCRTATIHSKMCNSFPGDRAHAEPVQQDSIESIKRALSGVRMSYSIAPAEGNRMGSGEGALVGGNLKTIESLTGSLSDIETSGKILFLEDTDEFLYSIDRMFWNLLRSGKLSKLRGLIIGGIKPKPDDPGEAFGMTLTKIIREKVSEFGYPVCFDFPIGHQKNNYALKCGIPHCLSVREDGVDLTEIPAT